ncbi:MAG: hypothetical protein Q8P95_00335, partial [bacterium]|nr:hypothetical protein [bacterium]
AKKIEKKKPKPQEKRTTLVRDLFQIKDPKLAMALERVVTDMLGIRSPGTQKFRAFCKWFQRELLFAEDKPLVRELTNRLIVSSLGVDVESELDAIQSEVQVRILMNFVSQGNEYENLVFGTFQVFFEEVRAVTVRELDEVRGKVADILKQVSLQYDALLATRDGSKVWKIRVVKAYRGRAITFDQARELLYPGEEVDDLRVQNRVSKIALANPHERIRASRPTDLAVVTPDHVVAAIRYKKGEIPESEIGQFLGVSPDLWDNILFLRDRMKKQIRQRFPRWFTLAEVPRQRAPGRLFSGPLRKHIKLLRKRADGDLSDDEFALALGIPPDKQGAVTNAITAIRNAFPEETRLLVRPSGLSHQEKLGIITDYEGGDRSDALMERARVTNAASLQSTIYRWRNALARVGLYRRNKGSVDREIGTP